MERNEGLRLLGMRKTRLEAMKKLMDQSIERCRGMSETGSPASLIREKININRLTVEINRLNDEIFKMEQELGIDPEGGIPGEIPADICCGICRNKSS